MNEYVENISFLDKDAIKAGNDHLELIIVPAWGSNLISLVEKKNNKELLRVPSSASQFWDKPVLFGTPILFPPNRIDQGTFTFNERVYQFDRNEVDKDNHIHGFVHTREWSVAKAEVIDDKVRIETEFNSSRYEEVLRQFPHHFTLKMTFTLDGASIHKDATVINKSDRPFPWGLGYHTTFLFPEDHSSFSLSAEKRWKLNERNLPTGELEKIEYKEKLLTGMILKNHPLDDVFISSVEKSGINQAIVVNEHAGIKITYKADNNFKFWVVYNNDGNQQFVCPEPYTWVTNAPNLDLDYSTTGLQVIEPNQEKTVMTKIMISKNDNLN
jgi:aldose 1-epimerase